MTRGTILQNMRNPEIDVYLIYIDCDGCNARCIKVIKSVYGIEINWECKMYKPNLFNNRDLYPIVGYIDPDELIKNAVFNAVKGGVDG